MDMRKMSEVELALKVRKYAAQRDALVQALEVCTTWLTARPAPDNVHYKAKAIAKARAALALAKE